MVTGNGIQGQSIVDNPNPKPYTNTNVGMLHLGVRICMCIHAQAYVHQAHKAYLLAHTYCLRCNQAKGIAISRHSCIHLYRAATGSSAVRTVSSNNTLPAVVMISHLSTNPKA